MIERKKNYKIAFTGWNPFQFIHIRKLALALEGSVFIVEKRNKHIAEFTDEILHNTEVPILVWEEKDMYKLDGIFDIIVAQSLFKHIPLFQKTKIVFLQYGCAKETHNYGTWRALSHLMLTYGSYTEEKISLLCPAVAVGNPRYDVWHEKNFHTSAEKRYKHLLDANKKTILYMPTWGDLSSVDLFLESIMALSSKYNILMKLHHNTDILEKNRVSKSDTSSIHYFGATDDALELLSLSDMVLTDYSGAIFDAIYCEKPLLLLDLPSEKLENIDKIDQFSLEINERDKLGHRVDNPKDLIEGIAYVEKNLKETVENQNKMKEKLFLKGVDSTTRAKEALYTFIEGGYQPTQMQTYLHETMIEFYATKRKLAILEKKKK